MNIFKYEKGIKRASLRKGKTGKMQEGQERKDGTTATSNFLHPTHLLITRVSTSDHEFFPIVGASVSVRCETCSDILLRLRNFSSPRLDRFAASVERFDRWIGTPPTRAFSRERWREDKQSSSFNINGNTEDIPMELLKRWWNINIHFSILFSFKQWLQPFWWLEWTLMTKDQSCLKLIETYSRTSRRLDKAPTEKTGSSRSNAWPGDCPSDSFTMFETMDEYERLMISLWFFKCWSWSFGSNIHLILSCPMARIWWIPSFKHHQMVLNWAHRNLSTFRFFLQGKAARPMIFVHGESVNCVGCMRVFRKEGREFSTSCSAKPVMERTRVHCRMIPGRL